MTGEGFAPASEGLSSEFFKLGEEFGMSEEVGAVFGDDFFTGAVDVDDEWVPPGGSATDVDSIGRDGFALSKID